MTAVTRAADAPRAASAISSSSTRLSCTGLTSGWIRNTSRSPPLACSWIPIQSFANRSTWTGCWGTSRNAQISAVSARWAVPPNTTISRTLGLPGPLHPVQGTGRWHRRQAELDHDLGLDHLHLGPCIDRDDVFLAMEQLEDR